MQILLRAACLVLAASLLWTNPSFAATPPKAQNTVIAKAKPKFIASTYHHASHVKLIYCDLHVCKDEKSRLIGIASFYGKHYWQGRKMANGNRFDYRKLTIASWGIPLGTVVRVTNLKNGKSVIAEVTDRGPAHALHRVADLSQSAAEQLDYIQDGTTVVLIQTVSQIEPAETAFNSRLAEFPEAQTITTVISPLL